MLKPQHIDELANPSALIESLLSDGISVSFEAHGSSMLPAIQPGDKLLVAPVRSFGPGDIVLMILERGLTAHRVIRVAQRDDVKYVTARGDNSSVDDPEVEVPDLIGVVTRVTRQGRTVRLERRSRSRTMLWRVIRRLRSMAGLSR